MSDFQSQILNIHDAFLLEFTRASCQLKELFEAVNSYIDCIVVHQNDNKNKQEEDIGKLQDICFFLKSICSEAYLNVNILTSGEADNVENDNVEENVESTLPDLNEILPYDCYSEVFTYSKVDPSKFPVGVDENFAVTYIKHNAERFFFVMGTSRTDFVVKQTEFRYNSVPDEGVIFGILLDGVVVRAVRENQLKSPVITFRVLLIDFGEILEISNEYKMYLLPEKLQKIPGQAIFCKLTNDNQDVDQHFLENILHTQQRMRIQKIHGNMLEVIVNPTEKSKMVNKVIKSIESSNRTGHITSVSSLHINEKTIPSITSSNVKTIKNGLTQEEIDCLFEEPLNTENALEAVMGYVPQDDKRICKFYDPKTKACFKGPNCKLEHTTILKDGWTKDTAIFKLKIHSEIPTPQVGTKVNLMVTYVVDVERFYGQVIPRKCKRTEDLPAEKIGREMNDDEMKSKLKRLTKAPAELELVFALYTDKLWYRAKIIEKFSDVLYQVRYVDYGNCYTVSLDNLRKWEDVMDRYPFQALECRLDNISKLKDGDKEATAYFESLVLQQPVIATVSYNIHQLYVTLKDEKGRYDIGEQLCIAKYAQQKLITGPVAGDFPG